MKPLLKDERTPNYDRHGKPSARCGVCDDNGWATATVRTETYNGLTATVEETAPCPFCMRGWRQEFPQRPDDKEKRKAWIEPPWGWEDGYWQGRDLPDSLVEAWVAAQQPKRTMSQAEQLAAIRALAAGLLGSVDREIEPPWGIEPEPAGERFFEPEPAEHMENVHHHYAEET